MQIARYSLGLAGTCVLLGALVVPAGCSRDAREEGKQDDSAVVEPSGEARSSGSRRGDGRKHPRLKIATSLGDIVVQLDSEKAFLTVDNFLRYAEDGYYDGTIFHDVKRGYAIIGGAHTEDLSRKPLRLSVRNEAANGLKNLRGAIAMAREPDVIDSATSVFFINLADNPHLDHRDDTPEGYGYCVFGKVVEGMDVADRIGQLAVRETTAKDGSPLPRLPVETVRINSVRLIR